MIPIAGIPLAQLSVLESTVYQLLQELPALIRASHVWEVQQRLNRCLWQTRTQLTRLEQAFLTLEGTPDRSGNTVLAALVLEAAGILRHESSSLLREATILFACQRTMRHELALYCEVLASRSSLPHSVVASLSLSFHERELSELQMSELLKEIVVQMRVESAGAAVVPRAPRRVARRRAIRASPAVVVPGSGLESGLGASVA